MSERRRPRLRWATILLAATLALPLATPARAQEPPAESTCVEDCHQPDGLIRRWNETAFIGSDVYNWDSLQQTRVALVTPEGRSRFAVRIENDAAVADTITVKGSPGTTQFSIRYFLGAREVTDEVVGGTLRFEDLPADGHRMLRIGVRARPAALEGSSVSLVVALRAADDVSFRDRVKAVVFRRNGTETRIEGRPFIGRAAAQRWARANGASTQFVANAVLYWELAPPRGIRPEVAYAQSAKETAYGRFGGVITPAWRNSCGLKITAGGNNSDPNAHQRFPSWRIGVIACIDHLALYAGAPTYPRADSPDPRHFTSIYTVAPTVERLGGRWAPAPDYGTSIVEAYLTPMLGF